MKDYKESISYLYKLQKYGIKFGLSSTKNLLNFFGNPHISQNYIHIAGTNGKGSVANFITSILVQAGYRVGLYTSPHLVRFTERIQINFEEISQKEVVDLVEELKKAIVPSEPPTFFEAVTAMALTYFSKKNVDIAVIEVGMGGRLDATNIITPLMSIITNISFDHQQFLGNTLKEIAFEKAGIIKEGIPTITGANDKEAIKVIKKICKEKNSKLFILHKDFSFEKQKDGFTYKGILGNIDDLHLSLIGDHQYENASIALAAIELLIQKGWNIRPVHIIKGLKSVKWPGRLHIVSKDPTVILDGAHNPEAIKRLKETVLSNFTYKKLILILGIMEDKDISSMLEEILEIADYVIFSAPNYTRAADPIRLMELSKKVPLKKEILTPLSSAIKKALLVANKEDLVLICGSLFTVGEALAYLKPDKYYQDL